MSDISAPTPGPKPRAVRGAKRTKKTEQALKMIENKNALARLPACFTKKQNRKSVGELSTSIGEEEKIEIEEDSFEIKVQLTNPPTKKKKKSNILIY